MYRPTINFVYFWPDINMSDMLDQTVFHPKHDAFWKKFLAMLLDDLTVDFSIDYMCSVENPYQFNIKMLSIIPNSKPHIRHVFLKNSIAPETGDDLFHPELLKLCIPEGWGIRFNDGTILFQPYIPLMM